MKPKTGGLTSPFHFLFVVLGLCLSSSTKEEGFKEFAYPAGQVVSDDYSLLGPEIVLIPKDGGVYMAGTDLWYLQPKEARKIVSISPDLEAGCIYYVKISNTDNKIYTTLVRLKKNGEGYQTEEELVKQESNSLFQVYAAGNNQIYLVEKGKTSRIWQCEDKKARLVFESEDMISAFCPVDPYRFLIAQGRKIIYCTLDREQEILFEMKEKEFIDGLCIDQKGEIYVSTYTGIWKIIAQADEKPMCGKVIPKLHGSLRFLNPYLFVHVPKASNVIRLTAEN